MDLTASIDYNIYSHQDRIVAVEKILDDPKVQDWIGKTADREGTQRQLETLANYFYTAKMRSPLCHRHQRYRNHNQTRLLQTQEPGIANRKNGILNV